MIVGMRDNILRPILATPILAAVVMMARVGSHRGARTFTGRDMAREIATAFVVASSLQEVICYRWIEQTDG